MNRIKINVISLLMLCCFAFQVKAQTADLANKVPNIKAEKEYAQNGYASASEIYEKQDPKKLSRETLLKLANSKRLSGDLIEAEKYYRLCLDDISAADDVYNFAQVLVSNGKCKESLQYFNKYKKLSSNGEKLQVITSCDEINRFPFNMHISVKNAEGINSNQLDFCPVYYQNGLIFTSNRDNNMSVNVKDDWTGRSFTDIYFAPAKGQGKYDLPYILSWNIFTQYHDGAVTFSPDYKEMYYSSNNKQGKSKKDMKDLKIYNAIYKNGQWENSDAFQFNSDEYNNCHPTLSFDGNMLIFASDMKGGYGGMDLYYCVKKDNIWSKPVNLGADINTSGNEIFPYFDVEGDLYYSSNGLKGMGGLDIFISHKIRDQFTWSTPVNAGYPFNSIKDDLSFSVSRDGREGYFASNREGGMGEDDIYYWTSNNGSIFNSIGPLATLLNPVVKDKSNGIPIEGANLSTYVAQSKTNDFKTDQNGEIGQQIDPNQLSYVDLSKPGYVNRRIYFNTNDGKTAEPDFTLEKIKSIPFSGNVKDMATNQAIEQANIKLKDTATGEESLVNSTENGAFNTQVSAINDSKVSISKENYLPSEFDLKNSASDYSNGKEIIRDIYLTPAPDFKRKKALVNDLFGSNAKMEDIEIGRSLQVKDIYYDFNKWNIRTDASNILDKLVELLNQYPTMQIELSSHTDCRGTDTSNQKLSQERAQSAVDYLVMHGISLSRLRAAGYGESMIKNNCADGVPCTEEQHQENRRTEVKILKM